MKQLILLLHNVWITLILEHEFMAEAKRTRLVEGLNEAETEARRLPSLLGSISLLANHCVNPHYAQSLRYSVGHIIIAPIRNWSDVEGLQGRCFAASMHVAPL